MTGTVRWFRDDRGFGFITGDDGSDLFFHHSAIQMEGYRSLNVGQRVEYDVQQSPKGPQAFCVTPLGPPPFQYSSGEG